MRKAQEESRLVPVGEKIMEFMAVIASFIAHSVSGINAVPQDDAAAAHLYTPAPAFQ
jgi:hypothetical protein